MANRGRPSKLNKDTFAKSIKFAKLGMTDLQIAAALDVSDRTIYQWKNDYPEFSQALKDAKTGEDGAVVRSLWERATGYSCPETKAQWVDDKDGARWEYAELVKHYPPDPTSMIFWLKNRQPQDWRDKQEITGANGASLFEGIEVVFKRPKDQG